MKQTLLFIHGMFMTGKSWTNWLPIFESLGYRCLAADWPLHESEPEDLRANPPEGAGKLALRNVVDRFAAIAGIQDEPPILIGHSVGGLIAQILLSRGLGSAAVCISPVAPNRMIAANWDFVKNSASITNPLKGDDLVEMTPEHFREVFANTMEPDEAHTAYRENAVHESRQVLRDCLGELGQMDTTLPHPPLLFIAGDSDKIIPATLVEKNAAAWTNRDSLVDYQLYKNRSHFICGEPGWNEVAESVARWLELNVPAHAITSGWEREKS